MKNIIKILFLLTLTVNCFGQLSGGGSSSSSGTLSNLTYGRVNAFNDLANVTYTNANNGVKIPFSNIVYSNGMGFVGTDFIVPSVTGRYHVSGVMQAGSGEFAGNGYFVIMQNGVFIARQFFDMMEAAGVNHCPISIDVDLTAGLLVELRYQPVATTDNVIWQVGSFFQLTQISNQLPVSGQVVFTGATAGANGTAGAVPVPVAGQENTVLKGDGTWQTLASTSLSGLTPATATNTIDNTLNAQNWNWSTATTQTPLTISAPALTTGSALTVTPSPNTVGITNNGRQLINVGTTSITTPLLVTGSINDYLEVKIKNTSTGIQAQSGYTAEADNGSATTGFAWWGINNSTFNFPTAYNAGVINDVTLVGSGQDLIIANANLTKMIKFQTGRATTPFFDTRMTILNNGNVGINTLTPAGKFDVVSTGTTTNGVNVSSTTLTSGSLVNLTSTSIGKLTNATGIKIALSGALSGASRTTYGADISNTHTGTTETNIGLQVSASGGTNNYALVVPSGNVGIGTTAPTSTLQVTGSFSLPFTSTGVANLTVLPSMHTVNCNNAGTAITVTLPTPIGITGRIYIVKRDFLSTGTVTIATVAGLIQSIVGSFNATTSLASSGNYGQSLMFQSDNQNWHLLN